MEAVWTQSRGKYRIQDCVWAFDKNCSDIKSINKEICSSMIVTSYFLPPEFSQPSIHPLLFGLIRCQIKEVDSSHFPTGNTQLKYYNENSDIHFCAATVKNWNSLPFSLAPESLMQALEDLDYLAALDNDGNLSEFGIIMSEFPLDPQLSKALLASCEFECVDEMLTIAAMVTGTPGSAPTAQSRLFPNLSTKANFCHSHPAYFK